MNIIRLFLAHKEYATDGEHGSNRLQNVIKHNRNTIEIDIQIQEMCLNEFNYVLLFMYFGYFNILPIELIPFYTLIERLNMNGLQMINELKNKIKQYSFNYNNIFNALKQCISFNNNLLIIECCNYIIKEYKNIPIYYWNILDIYIVLDKYNNPLVMKIIIIIIIIKKWK